MSYVSRNALTEKVDRWAMAFFLVSVTVIVGLWVYLYMKRSANESASAVASAHEDFTVDVATANNVELLSEVGTGKTTTPAIEESEVDTVGLNAEDSAANITETDSEPEFHETTPGNDDDGNELASFIESEDDSAPLVAVDDQTDSASAVSMNEPAADTLSEETADALAESAVDADEVTSANEVTEIANTVADVDSDAASVNAPAPPEEVGPSEDVATLDELADETAPPSELTDAHAVESLGLSNVPQTLASDAGAAVDVEEVASADEGTQIENTFAETDISAVLSNEPAPPEEAEPSEDLATQDDLADPTAPPIELTDTRAVESSEIPDISQTRASDADAAVDVEEVASADEGTQIENTFAETDISAVLSNEPAPPEEAEPSEDVVTLDDLADATAPPSELTDARALESSEIPDISQTLASDAGAAVDVEEEVASTDEGTQIENTFAETDINAVLSNEPAPSEEAEPSENVATPDDLADETAPRIELPDTRAVESSEIPDISQTLASDADAEEAVSSPRVADSADSGPEEAVDGATLDSPADVDLATFESTGDVSAGPDIDIDAAAEATETATESLTDAAEATPDVPGVEQAEDSAQIQPAERASNEVTSTQDLTEDTPPTESAVPLIAESSVTSHEPPVSVLAESKSATSPQTSSPLTIQPIPATTHSQSTTVQSTVPQPFLGVGIRDRRTSVVTSLHPGTTAQRLGIMVGDEIVSINGKPVSTLQSLRAIVAGIGSNNLVTIKIRRQASNFDLGPAVLTSR